MAKGKMRAALIVNPVTSDMRANVEAALAMVREAAGKGANLVLLGEMALTGMLNNDDPAHDLPLGESIPGPLTERLAKAAADLQVWLGLGLLEREGTCLYDTAVLLSPRGELALRYCRVQPNWHGRRADPAVYCQGTELLQVETEFGSLACMICGDLWDDDLRAASGRQLCMHKEVQHGGGCLGRRDGVRSCGGGGSETSRG